MSVESPWVVYGVLALFTVSGVLLLVALCVAAARADRRMREWMTECQRCADPLEAAYAALSAKEPERVR